MGEEKSKGFSIIDQFVQLDKKLSESFSVSATESSPYGNLRSHMKALEYSCHGLFWISGAIILLYFSDDPKKEAFFFNLLLALTLDILFVAVIKAAIHRKRPSYNDGKDMFLTISVDKMSCPSGHTSRVVLLTYLFISCTPDMKILHFLLLMWCFFTSLSRVMLGRHYIGDVAVGAVLGYVEYIIMDSIWAGPDTANWYLGFFRSTGTYVDDF